MTYTYKDANGTVHTRVITVPGAVSLHKRERILREIPAATARIELTGNYTRHTPDAQFMSASEVYASVGGCPLIWLG